VAGSSRFSEPFNALIGEQARPVLWDLQREVETRPDYQRSRTSQSVARVRDLVVVEIVGQLSNPPKSFLDLLVHLASCPRTSSGPACNAAGRLSG
jgi:hypothetical protein